VGNWLNKKQKTQFIENSVDINLFKPTTKNNKINLRKNNKLPQGKPIIIFVGRMVEVKGFDKLFEARSKEYFLLFIGPGDVPEHMKKDKTVKFIPSVEQSKLKELYQLSDIFILPSMSEGFPLTVLEAMASGLPIIVSDLPIYKKYLDAKNISIIQSTPENIKNSIMELLSNKSKLKQMEKYSREVAMRKFSWEKNAKKLFEVYSEILNKNETKS
jgi:glycosyltransferase involved in cell wall biosynthesis